MTKQTDRRGSVLIFVLIFTVVLLGLTAGSVLMVRSRTIAQETRAKVFSITQIAESAVSQALTRIRDLGMIEPCSGNGQKPAWVPFGDKGGFLYYTTFHAADNISTIRAWGRIPKCLKPADCAVPPDDPAWHDRDWMIRGLEVVVMNRKFIPETALFFGNGGVERPAGGFEWTSATDISNSNTWSQVPTGSASSYQASSIPFEVNALNHPMDHLYNGTACDTPAGYPHPYSIWSVQNPIGQANIEAWFKHSAGAGHNPLTNVYPNISNWYEDNDPHSLDYQYPVDPDIPDVQTYAEALWNKYHADPSAVLLGSGSHTGTVGDLSTPKVTFVTGTLRVPAGKTFEGAGILVIRDNYDSNDPTASNRPRTSAQLKIEGTFKWTGLVIITGWCPAISTTDTSDSTIVGSLFGEDSVMSGGETSLDCATIVMRIKGPFRIRYSKEVFSHKGLIYDYLPYVRRKIVGIRDI